MRSRGVDELPAAFGRYELTSLLGQGGMGKVYRATLTGPSGFRKEVALKVIKAQDSDDRDAALESFVREARVCGLLRHPNVVDVYDFGVTDEQPWIAMELVDGWPFDDILRDHPDLPPTVVLDAAIQIIDGLVHAHELVVEGRPVALVHRDLKPANVLVTRQGGVKVMDFGLARATEGEDALTRSGVVRGTPAYMSPEQASGEDLDPRSDLFSFGIMLYELAVGERPFLRPSVIALIMALVSVEDALADPEFLGRPEGRVPGIAAILERCLRREPSDRYDRARDVAADLRQLLRSQPAGPSLRSWVDAKLLGNAPAAVAELGSMQLSAVGTAALEATGFAGTGSQGMAVRSNLGSDGSSFIGRERDLEQLASLAESSRLVSVVGSGGTGKTRLVRHFARQGMEPWLAAGGLWFCDLAAATDLTGVLAAVASPLGVPLERARGDQAAIDQVGFAIAGRGRVLLVLDNVEQVLAPTRRVLERWMEFASDALFLVTSRERLRAAGEAVLELGPLAEPEAVQLFRERARAVRADFAVTPGVAPFVSRIVRQLDGIPLAVELAAARVTVLTPEQILDRLSERFKLLRGRGQTGDRQATLQATIEWSWNLLEPAERGALAQCSVFRGTFDLESVEEILELEDANLWALDAVEILRDKSLIRAEQVRELGGAIRFRLYESIRAFAAGQLAAGPRAAAEHRHAQYFLAWGERQLKQLDGKKGRRARRELTWELDNLNAVCERYLDSDPEIAARAVLIMAPVLRLIGPLDGHVDLLERTVSAADAAHDRVDGSVRARLHQARGHMRRIRARFDDAQADFDAALALAEASADRLLEGLILEDMSWLALDQGHVNDALEIADRLTAIADAVGDRRLQAGALFTMGRCLAFDPEAFTRSHELLTRALRAHEDLGLLPQSAMILQALAISTAQTMKHTEATALFKRALELHRDLGNRRGQAAVTGNLGLLAIQVGRTDEAEKLFARCLRMQRRLGDRRAVGIFQMNRGVCRALVGRETEAVADLESGIRLLERYASPYYHGAGWRYLGTVLQRQQRWEEADRALRRAQEIFAVDETGWMRASGDGTMATLLADRDEVVEADVLLARCDEGIKDPSGAAFAAICRGHLELAQARAYRDAGDHASAAALIRRVEERLRWRGYEVNSPRAEGAQEATNRLACAVLQSALERTRGGQEHPA